MTRKSVAALSLLLSWHLLTISVLGAAAHNNRSIHFICPMQDAKTFEVTETSYGASGTTSPGPLQYLCSTRFIAQRPDKFRVSYFASGKTQPSSEIVSDGKILTTTQGARRSSQPAGSAEWPFPLVGLFNMPGPLTGKFVLWNGKKVLLTDRQLGPLSVMRTWYDPQTRLPLEDSMLMTWKGKTSEVVRTVYTGWKINPHIPSSEFAPRK